MGNRTIEIMVGIFVIIGLICVGYLTVKLGKINLFGNDSYPIFARFQSVSGLKTGASVEMAGVEIGKVEKITLDDRTRVAVVRMRIINGLTIMEDAIATVSTAGLIGDKFIKISPGGSDLILKPGDSITETESSLNLEELVGKYVFGNVSQPEP
ncbi:MAG: outer membrane lipid asymmetry maintenance protein MlaD [Deltaproteobacteria bacterium]|nr:outer membrane lipid asymmetry maintenance protein MlaD [Deltaproteobacteria bacterium]